MTAAPSEAEVLSWFETLSNHERFGPDDTLGTANLITPAKRVEAARLVTEGVTVSCAWDIGGAPPIDGPVQRFMLATGQGSGDAARVAIPGRESDRSTGAGDYLGVAYHGYTITHVDALSHVFWDGTMYGGHPSELVTSSFGATRHDVRGLRDGVVTRGVLLDVARLRDVPWLEPGEAVSPAELEAAEDDAGVRVEPGDVLLLRTGYGRKRRELGPDDVATVGRAGWHAACLPWFRERGVAMIGADTAQDAMPSGYPSLRSPIHSIGIAAMGLWLLDNCDLEELSRTCANLARWAFQFCLAPLRWVGATGSPANPLAML